MGRKGKKFYSITYILCVSAVVLSGMQCVAAQAETLDADDYWQWATNKHTAQAYRCFLYHYPDDSHVPLAKKHWEELDFEWTQEVK